MHIHITRLLTLLLATAIVATGAEIETGAALSQMRELTSDQLKAGAQNVLCVRVHNQVGAGGIWRPVHAIAAPAAKDR